MGTGPGTRRPLTEPPTRNTAASVRRDARPAMSSLSELAGGGGGSLPDSLGESERQMPGGMQARWCEVVPPAESSELLRLALLVRSVHQVNVNDPAARQELQQVFATLGSIEQSAHRLRELALDQLVRVLGERPRAFVDLHDLAVVAGVASSHLERLIGRAEPDSSLRRGALGGDAGD